jgi:carboxylesterase type B
MRAISLYNLLLWGGSATLVLADRNDAPTATIDAGVVVGKSTSLPNALGPVDQFLGIPFGKSPPERFSPARPAARFSTAFNATEFKPACIQQFRCRCYTK